MGSKEVKATGKVRPPNAGKGRKPGVPNKVTASIKQAITDAFDRLGGVPSLVAWGKENPTAFYTLWGRLAPQEVTGKDGGPIQGRLEVRFVSE